MKKVILIVVGVLVLIGGGVAGYAMLSRGDANTETGSILSAVKSLNPNCKYNDPDLCKFINAWNEISDFTVNTTTTMKDGKSYTSVFKFNGDDNSQITNSLDGKENYNVITLGNTMYTKDYTDNKWTKTALSQPDETVAETKSDFNFDEKAEQTEDKTEYKKIGKEACDKLQCFKYQIIYPDDTDNTHYIYFDDKEYRLRKMRTEAKDGTVSESTFSYTKFNLTEPSPIKESSSQSVPTAIPSALLQSIEQEVKKNNATNTAPDTSSENTNDTSTESSDGSYSESTEEHTHE